MYGHDRKLRPVALLVVALVLLVGGCGDDDSATRAVAPTTQAPTTGHADVEPTTSTPSSPLEGTIDATVFYEPRKCTYLGPAVVPLGSTVTFEFDDGGHAVAFVVGRLIDGATREEIVEYNETHGGPYTYPLTKPDYAVSPEPEYYREGAGSLKVEFWDASDWVVLCWTPSNFTNKYYLGGMIQVIEG